MFDYVKWRDWLKEQASVLQSDSIVSMFHCSPDDRQKPSMSLGLKGSGAIGSFECWSTGEADYTIHKIPASGNPSNDVTAYQWGVILNDQTFRNHFNEFQKAFRQTDSGINAPRPSTSSG
jgi:hypothetical protein